MAVQLILKNSAVQDKEATANQLATGELALNYYESGPFLQCKDTAGNIWRLGGVVIASTAPSSPSKGAWWLDSDDNHLYFYNGSSWVEVQTGEITASDIAEGTARQLLQTNAAGTATEWTSNIDVPGTLDVTGVATFDNNVVIEGNLTVNGTTTTIDTETLLVEDKNIEMGVVTTPTDLTADGGGITLKGATDKTINWVNATDAWTSSERFSVPLGAQGTPSLTFTGDANTGIYSPGADQVAISTGGTGRLFVDANGRLLAGTTDAGYTSFADNLTLASSANCGITLRSGTTNQGNIYFSDATGTGVGTYAGIVGYRHDTNAMFFHTGSTERLRIDSSGRLLVGTSTARNKIFNGTTGSPPQFQTEISGAGIPNRVMFTGNPGTITGDVGPTLILARSAGTTNDSYTAVTSDASHLGMVSFQGADGTEFVESARIESRVDGTPGANNMPGRLVFYTNSGAASPSERMRISANGNVTIDTNTFFVDAVNNRVGVGTTSPSEKLTVNGSIDLPTINTWIKGGGHNVLQVDATKTYFYGGTGGIQLRTADNVSELINITNAGLVGIGTSSPGTFHNFANRLVIGSGSGDAGLTCYSGNTSIGAINFADGTSGNDLFPGYIAYNHSNNSLGFWVNYAGSSSPRLFIDSSGRVGIGTTSPSTSLHIAGTATPQIRLEQNNSSIKQQIESISGDLVLTTDVTNAVSGAANIEFWRGTTESARIDSSGRLLVGTSSGTGYGGTKLVLHDSSSPRLRLTNSTTGEASGDGVELVLNSSSDFIIENRENANTRFYTNSGERVRIEATGKTKFFGAAYGVENTITASAFNLNEGNLWTCGAIAIPNPTNAVAGLMGSIRVTAAPTSFGSNFDHPGGSYTAPTSFPAVAPFYCVSSTNILLGSWTQGIA